MQHSVEQLIERINAMHDKAVEVHRLRNQYSDLSEKTYDKSTCLELIRDIQAMALGIAMDKQGDDIITEMDSWKHQSK